MVSGGLRQRLEVLRSPAGDGQSLMALMLSVLCGVAPVSNSMAD